MADQFRSDWIGAAGASWVHTPNIDSIAARGVRFDRAYTTCPICAPARVSLANGMDPIRNGPLDNSVRLNLRDRTYYQELRDAGYRVGCSGKLDLAKQDIEMGNGDRPWTYSWGFTDPVEMEGKMSAGAPERPRGPFTRFLDAQGLYERFHEDYVARKSSGWIKDALHDSPLPATATSDAYVGQRAVDWLKSVPDGNPWHLFVSFVGPHDPFDPPTEYADRYRNAAMPAPEPIAYEGASSWVRNRSKGLSPAEVQVSRRQYAALIHLIDDWVGALLLTLGEIGAADNTVILFTSDHGEMLGDMGLYTKQVPYEPSVRIPLLACGPGIAHGAVADSLVELHDINPTICEICGVSPSPGMDARSFASVLREPGSSHRETYISAFSTHHTIGDGRYKYIRFPDEGISELYDLSQDPHETSNIVASSQEVADRLEKLLGQRLAGTNTGPDAPS